MSPSELPRLTLWLRISAGRAGEGDDVEHGQVASCYLESPAAVVIADVTPRAT
jgi:hypothetical protein